MSSQLGRLRAVATEDLQRVHAWWRAANYLSVGQIHLLDTPVLRDHSTWSYATSSTVFTC